MIHIYTHRYYKPDGPVAIAAYLHGWTGKRLAACVLLARLAEVFQYWPLRRLQIAASRSPRDLAFSGIANTLHDRR